MHVACSRVPSVKRADWGYGGEIASAAGMALMLGGDGGMLGNSMGV